MKTNRLVFGMMAAALAAHAHAAPAPFASGESGTLKWEARFNLPVCNHEGQAPGAWCTMDDVGPSAEVSGVEARLKELMNDPATKSVTMAYFSFSNKRVRAALCEAANKGVRITAYIDAGPSQIGAENVQTLKSCSPNVRVVPVGPGTFGGETGFLQHMKIFMASPMEAPKPLHELTASERETLKKTRTTVTSSSANMSSFGTNIHIENWLFLESNTEDHVIQANTCTFKGLEAASKKKAAEQRAEFVKVNADCLSRIAAKERRDLKFFAVPHGNVTAQPFQALRSMVNGAKDEILVAIHRLTTQSLVKPLASAARRGVDLRVVMDDDSLRTGKVDGGHAHDVGADDVLSHRTLTAAGARVKFMETNAEGMVHLHHNKFVVVDRKALFQGAGNFTASSLNTSRPGNFEHFYVITVPGIVDAYARAHEELYKRATFESRHPVGANEDKKLIYKTDGFIGFEEDCDSDDGECQEVEL